MTAPTLPAALTATEAADLPLGRLLTREQALLWLGCSDADLDQAAADQQILTVRYADAPEGFPQAQFDRRRCSPVEVAVACQAFGLLDRSGALAACWLSRTSDCLDVTWQGCRIRVVVVGGWPVITVQAV